MPVTVLQCAEARGAKADGDGAITMDQVHDAGLPFFGGCLGCQESLACYNAYPTTQGYLACAQCVGESGFETTQDFESWCQDNAAPCEPDDQDDDPNDTEDYPAFDANQLFPC